MLLAGSAMILSRQLEIVMMTALVAILLAIGGWRALLPEVQRRAPVLICVIALLGLQTLAVGVWEFEYDVNGKRYAVGATKDTVWFFPDAQWSPPFGWSPWVILALVSTVAMIAAVAFPRRQWAGPHL